MHLQGVLDKDLRLFSDAFFCLIDVDNDGKKIIGFDKATLYFGNKENWSRANVDVTRNLCRQNHGC